MCLRVIAVSMNDLSSPKGGPIASPQDQSVHSSDRVVKLTSNVLKVARSRTTIRS